MQDRNGRCIMLVNQNKMSQWKITMWFHIIDNFCVVHGKHDRANWSDIAHTINQPGNTKDVSRCIICDCTYCTADCYIVYWLCFQNLEMRNIWLVAVWRVSHQLTILLHPSYAHINTVTTDLLLVSVHVTLSKRKGNCGCADKFCKNNRNCISMWSEIKCNMSVVVSPVIEIVLLSFSPSPPFALHFMLCHCLINLPPPPFYCVTMVETLQLTEGNEAAQTVAKDEQWLSKRSQ